MAEKEGSIAAQAWNATKDPTDPEFGASPEPEFWGKLEFAAQKVIETGTANTNFELKVKELHGKSKATEKAIGGPMAVVEEPAAITAGATERQTDTSKSAAKTETKAEAKPDAKKVEQAKALKSTDKSGHVPDAKEKAAIVKEQATSPKHP